MKGEEATALLQEELTRQNKIIDALLNRNKELEERCHAWQEWRQSIIHIAQADNRSEEAFIKLANASEHSAADIYKMFLPIIEKIVGGHKMSCPAADFMMGKNKSVLSSVELMVDKNKSVLLAANLMDDKKENELPAADLMIGKNEMEDAILKKMMGKVETGYRDNDAAKGDENQPDRLTGNRDGVADTDIPHDKNANAASQIAEASASKQEGKINIWALQDKISRVIVRSNNSGLVSAATILERLEQSPKQSMKQLQSLTGLTQTGMGKRIASLKKYGLIKRGAHRQLLLTDTAKQMLNDARR